MHARPAAAKPGRVAAVVIAAVAALGVLTGTTDAAFTSQTSNTANSLAAAPDWVPPVVTASVAAPVSAGSAVPLQAGGSYYVYASATDGGGTPSGVSAVTADMSTITSGATAVALVAGTYTLGGTSYGWRSPALTANAGLAPGPYAYTHTTVDAAGNTSGVQSGFSATVYDGPVGVDVQGTNNSGGIVGQAEPGDRVTFTYSEPIDPNSVLPGWTGSATSVIVRFVRSGGTKTLTVRNAADTANLPFGVVNVGNHAANRATVDYLNSSMTHAGGVVSITLGSVSGAPQTAPAADMSWQPDAAVTDVDGNPAGTAAVLEGGPSDADF